MNMDLIDKLSVLAAVAAIAIISVVAGDFKDSLTPFPCGVDVCNQFSKPQFCNHDRCLDCDNRIHQCGTWQMPVNCSYFCYEVQTNKFIDSTCPPPWRISNGYMNISSPSYGRHLTGTTLIFVCDEGYQLNGTNTFLCNDQGQWIPGTAAPVCIPADITCSPPWNISNGHWKVSSSSYRRELSETTLTFECDGGYEMNGNNTFRCNDQGLWSPKTTAPFCTPESTSSQSALFPVLFAVACVFFVVISVLSVWQCLKIKKLVAKTQTPNNPLESLEANENTPFLEGNVPKDENNPAPTPTNANGNGPHDRSPDVPRHTDNDQNVLSNADTVADDNTDPKQVPAAPRGELDNVTNTSNNTEEDRTKVPVQVETEDETKAKGTSPHSSRNDLNGNSSQTPENDQNGTSLQTSRNDQNNIVCEEVGGPDNKSKMAIGANTIRKSDLLTNSGR